MAKTQDEALYENKQKFRRGHTGFTTGLIAVVAAVKFSHVTL